MVNKHIYFPVSVNTQKTLWLQAKMKPVLVHRNREPDKVIECCEKSFAEYCGGS